MEAKIIVNPAAGRGRCARLWPEIREKLTTALGAVDISLTEEAGHEAELAREAVAAGLRHIVVVGGDGTLNGALNGVMTDRREDDNEPAPVFSPVPAGTANELARELGFHGDVDAAVRAAVSGQRRHLDLLECTCASPDSGEVRRFGYLSISWGAAAEISHRTNTSRYLKRLGGELSYFMVTLIVTLTYQHRTGQLRVDENRWNELVHYTGLICNTPVLGGGMRIAPGADATDGVADLVLFGDISRWDILLQKPSWLFEGRHLEHDAIDLIRGREFSIEGPQGVWVDADGETIGQLPLQVRVRPGAFAVRA